MNIVVRMAEGYAVVFYKHLAASTFNQPTHCAFFHLLRFANSPPKETLQVYPLNHVEIENLNRPIRSKEIESVITNLSANKKAQDQIASLVNSIKHFKN